MAAEIEKKVTQLDAITAITDDDLLYLVNDPSGTPTSKKVTVANMAATAAQRGLVELATTAEAQAGVDTARAVTPAGVAAYLQQPITIGVGGSVEGAITLANLAAIDWHLWADEATWFTHANPVLYIGNNRTTIGTWEDSAQHSFGMVFEADYYSDATTHSCEWYVEYRAGDGTTRRPFQCAVNLETDAVLNMITGRMQLFASDGTQRFEISETGIITIYTAGQSIQHGINNVGFIRQRNAANSGYIDLLMLNSADQASIGAPVTMWGDILFNHNSAHGVILMDRVGGAQYRLKVTSGVLGIEAV